MFFSEVAFLGQRKVIFMLVPLEIAQIINERDVKYIFCLVFKISNGK